MSVKKFFSHSFKYRFNYGMLLLLRMPAADGGRVSQLVFML